MLFPGPMDLITGSTLPPKFKHPKPCPTPLHPSKSTRLSRNLVAVWRQVSYFLSSKKSMVLCYGLRKWEIDRHTATKSGWEGMENHLELSA
jgi:hypothetical protein